MNLTLTAGLAFASLLFAVSGCTGNAGVAADDGVASQDELTSATHLVGAFHGAGDSGRPPTFTGIVFQSSGDFIADVDTGIRCVRAPCPSHVRLEGHFTATPSSLRLSARAGAAPGEGDGLFGQYRYSFDKDTLTISRTNDDGWSNVLVKELSYCAAPVDCDGQDLIHPMCVGTWSCSEQRSCAWSCD